MHLLSMYKLNCDDKTMVQPDVLVVCDREKSYKKVYIWSTGFYYRDIVFDPPERKDMFTKLAKYKEDGSS